MLAIADHVNEALTRQADDAALEAHPEARRLVERINATLTQHVRGLEGLSEQVGATTQSTVKNLATRLLGAAAGLYDQVRGQHPVSRDLRDDYTSLSLLAMAYTSFHAYGLTIGDERIARLALQHLKDLTPLMIDLSEVLPEVVVREVAEESNFQTDSAVGAQAVANTQTAWSREVTESV
jgi:hypothetical protein